MAFIPDRSTGSLPPHVWAEAGGARTEVYELHATSASHDLLLQTLVEGYHPDKYVRRELQCAPDILRPLFSK